MKLKFNTNVVGKISIFALIALVFAGCGKTPSAKPVNLVIWSVFEDSSQFQPLLSYYQKKHPSSTVSFVVKPVETYEEDLINALASGQGPDIFTVNNAWLPKYLDKVVPAPAALWNYTDYKNAFVDVVVNDFVRDRKIYGTANYVDSLALYYNKDLLGSAGIATPPKTWDELQRDTQKLTRQSQLGYFNRSGVALGLSSTAPGGQIHRAEDLFYLFELQKGGQSWSPDGSTPLFGQAAPNGISSQPAVDAINFYTSFSNPVSRNYTWNTKSDYSIDAFANGRAAMIIDYSYARQLIQQKASNLNFDVAPVPQPDLENPEINFANYWGYVVSKQSKSTDGAWEFLKTISDKAALDQYYAAHKLPSSRKDLIELQTQDPDIGVFAHANLTAKNFYRPDQRKVDALISKMLDDVTLRGIEAGTALGQALGQAGAITIPRP